MIIMLIMSISMMGQHNITKGNKNTILPFVQRYMDSLTVARDSVYVPDSTFQLKQTSAKLFLPLTFYSGIAHRAFTPGLESLPLDSTLAHIYLSRPDLVKATQCQLEKIGPTRKVDDRVKTNRPNLVDKVAPKAIEADIEPMSLKIYRPNFWNFSGDYYLQFLQNFISDNWYRGGESNYSALGSITLNLNYNNKQKVKWDNKLEVKLGMQTSKGDSLHNYKVTEDLLRYTGKLGLQATKKWYYTLQFIAYTQAMRGYNTNSNEVYTDFFSPLNMNLSVGMDYNVDWFKHRLKGTVHLAPAAYNMKYVDRLDLAERYGLEAGNHFLHDIGSEITVDLTWKFSDMIKWKTRLYGYTTYKRSEIEWENTITFQFNRYISTNLFLYPRFDDASSRNDKLGYFQFKEYLSLGFSYSM